MLARTRMRTRHRIPIDSSTSQHPRARTRFRSGACGRRGAGFGGRPRVRGARPRAADVGRRHAVEAKQVLQAYRYRTTGARMPQPTRSRALAPSRLHTGALDQRMPGSWHAARLASVTGGAKRAIQTWDGAPWRPVAAEVIAFGQKVGHVVRCHALARRPGRRAVPPVCHGN